MKKNKKIFYALLCALGFALCMGVGCSDGKGSDSVSTDSSSVEDSIGPLALSESSRTVIFGDEFQLNASGGTRDTSKYVWSSSDPTVATVEDGLVQAVGKGETTVSVSFGDETATCAVSVSFGDLQPSLYVNNVADDTLTLKKGDEYSLSCKVLFNGKFYPCDATVTPADTAICEYKGNAVSAKEVGETAVTVQGEWNGFDNGFMQKQLLVTVLPNVDLYVEIEQNGKTTVSDVVELSLVDSWEGNEYFNTATLRAYALVDDERIPVVLQTENGNEVIEISDGEIMAKGIGSATVSAFYTYEKGAEPVRFESSVRIHVTCPVVEYQGHLDLCTSKAFPTETLFGEDAEILSVKQGNKDLSFRGSNVQGILPMGEETEEIEVCTTVGGYRFRDVFAYTMALTSENLMSVFKLQSNKKIDGYYILNSDVTIDAKQQVAPSESSYFAGIFDGRGHTVSATVGQYGVFGGLGDDAVIKNTRFAFTFDTTKEYACGISANGGTYHKQEHKPTLENLYVTTTNYAANTFSLMYYRPVCLKMKSVYVQLSGVEKMADYESVGQLYGALFSYDAMSITGPYSAFFDDFADVYVVSGKFMPIANIKWNSGDHIDQFVTYAKNDEEALGGEGALKRDTANAGEANFCKVYPKENSEEAKKLFGEVRWNNQPSWYAWLYESYVPNGGIARYDTTEELKAAGITVVGTWEIV